MNTIEIPELTITREVLEVSTIDLPEYPNFVKWVNILVKGEDAEGRYGEINTVYSFDTLSLNQDFISFENISQETILSWIDNRVGQSQIERSIQQVKRNYIEQNFAQNFYSVNQLPWNS